MIAAIGLYFFLITGLPVPALSMAGADSPPAKSRDGQLTIVVLDSNGKQLPCRIHLLDEKRKPIQVPNQVYWHDHFVCNGKSSLALPAGLYHYEIEKGPEFEKKTGTARITEAETQQVRLELNRVAHLNKDGWFSGDMHVHRPPKNIRLLMQAEDLNFAPVITWWNRPADKIPPPAKTVFKFDRSRIYTTMAGEDERNGGALLFLGLDRPLDLTVKSKEYPSPMAFVRQAREINRHVWIDIEKPFWWDVPIWLASGKMNSIGIANNHMCRSQMLANEAWGKPREIKRLPSPRGNGFWTQEIYYQMLNCGIHLAPSAGSASGVLANPVGYNRVYVHCGDNFNHEKWFERLKQGQAFVTNGPLCIAKVNSHLPGHHFEFQDLPQTLNVSVELTSHDYVPELEVVYNGKVVKKIACAKQLKQTRNFSIDIDQPGWFLVRAITDVKSTFRFASTAPWFVKSPNGQPVVSRSSAQFFLDWTRERLGQVRKNISDPVQLNQVMKHHMAALDYWEQKVKTANRR